MEMSLSLIRNAFVLYCNKSKWGDVENHYDFMHPIPQQTCKSKSYDRRRESEQIIYEQTKNIQMEEQHRQTKIDDEESGQQRCEQ
eukprot:1109518-Heterocapsa_arctica.AAC.1